MRAAAAADDFGEETGRFGWHPVFNRRPRRAVPRFLDSFTFDRLLTTLLFLTVVLACALTPMQADTWWQLRAGRDMWATGRVMLADVYSHTSYGAFWLNHEWLAEVIYYGAYRAAGLPGVTLFAAALDRRGWSITWRLTRGPVRSAFLWTLAALVPSSMWWEPRPHAFSLLFIPATVFLVARGRTRMAADRVRDLGELPRRRAARIRPARHRPLRPDRCRAAHLEECARSRSPRAPRR